MKYYLKIFGHTKANPNEDFITRVSSAEVDSAFWQDISRSWLSDITPKICIGDIFIQYVPLGEPRNNGIFKGRVLGYYKVISDEISDKLENHWFKYVQVENLYKDFSERSKYKELLNIRKFKHLVKLSGGTIVAGYKEIDEKTAGKIIAEIKSK